MRKLIPLILVLVLVTAIFAAGGVGMGWNTPSMVRIGISDWALLMDSFPTWPDMVGAGDTLTAVDGFGVSMTVTGTSPN